VRGEGSVGLTAERRGDRLHLTVTDDGPGLSNAAEPLRGTGHGLAITRDRLARLYGDRFALELRSRDAGGSLAVIDLPFTMATDPRTVA
jgi:signal transduction histidine kinase